MNLTNKSNQYLWFKLFCLTIIATLTFEHSQFDVMISKIFYSDGHWLLEKGAQPYAFIFYNLPKLLLIVFAIYLLVVLVIKSGYFKHIAFVFNRRGFNRKDLNKPRFLTQLNKFFLNLSKSEISYLLLIIAIAPASIAVLKSVTHVSCPNHLVLFGGNYPYLSIWENIQAKIPLKCFPAAHASTGFALYGFVFIPALKRYRYRVFEIVTFLGWALGAYKMLMGDHFFSHTLVSMLLSLTIASGFATLFFSKHES